MTDYAALKAEIAKPAYAGMTDAQIAAAINAAVVTLTPSPMTLTSGAIYNAIVPSEWAVLSAAQQQQVRDVLIAAAGGIDVSAGTNARAILLAVFGAGTTTRANLAAAVKVVTTLTETFGWPKDGLNDQEIAAARVW